MRYSHLSHIMWTQAWDAHQLIWDGRLRCSGSWMLSLDMEWYEPQEGNGKGESAYYEVHL